MLVMIHVAERRFVREVREGKECPIIRGRRIHSAEVGWTDGVFALVPLVERPITPGKIKTGAAPSYTVRENDGDLTVWDVEKVWPETDPPPPKTDEERVDDAFQQRDDLAKVLFEALFEIVNEIRALKSQPALTRAQLRDWLKAKLP